jgi:hypothetical protein
MSFGPTIAEIKSRITVGEAAVRLGYAGEISRLCRSPFPQEHKHGDRNKSFSVYDDGRRWKNHATDEGGDVIDFVQKYTGTDQTTALKLLKEWLGFSAKPLSEHPNRRTPAPRRPKNSAPRAVLPAVTPPAEASFAVKPMPASERQLWDDGCTYLGTDSDFAAEIDLWRGWRVGTTSHLVTQSLISAPLLRGRRALAFPVQAPRKRGWEAIGFHARHNPTDDQAKAWSFHPKGIPALPFMLGMFGAARLVVILEGQFDAITFASAAGWLECGNAWPEEIAVVGIRGATSWRTFIKHWLPHWPTAPKFLLIPDADEAGQRWKGDFADALRAQALSVHILSPRAGAGKDLSDLNKAHPYGPADIARMLQGLRLISAQGVLI